jgi:hypothetical protein
MVCGRCEVAEIRIRKMELPIISVNWRELSRKLTEAEIESLANNLKNLGFELHEIG